MHQFTWDFRYERPEPPDPERESPFREGGGPWALPGAYSVRLNASGLNLEQPLSLKLDPRIRTSIEDLNLQFALASRVADDLKSASEALAELARFDTQLAVAGERVASGEALAARVRRCRDDIHSIAGDKPESHFEALGIPAPPTNPAWLSIVADDLRRLLGSVESADAAPTAESREAFADADRRLAAALDRWRRLYVGEVSDLLRATAAPARP